VSEQEQTHTTDVEPENPEPEPGSEGLSDEELNEQRAGEGEEPHAPAESS
jgi:hypothetical protein